MPQAEAGNRHGAKGHCEKVKNEGCPSGESALLGSHHEQETGRPRAGSKLSPSRTRQPLSVVCLLYDHGQITTSLSLTLGGCEMGRNVLTEPWEGAQEMCVGGPGTQHLLGFFFFYLVHGWLSVGGGAGFVWGHHGSLHLPPDS